MLELEALEVTHLSIMQENKLSVICERVFDRCLAPTAGGEGCDNMTMILVQFKKPFNSGDSSSEPQPSTGGDDSTSEEQQPSQSGTCETKHDQPTKSETGSAD